MKQYGQRDSSRNSQLDLFDFIRERALRANPAAPRIARRFALSVHLATTIARLAGLGEQSR